MGTYVFACLNDMFEFFRASQPEDAKLRVNHGYWGEKVQAADHAGVTEYSAARFRAAIEWHLSEECTGEPPSPDLLAAVKNEVLSEADDGEYAAKKAAIDFTFGGRQVFTDFWETNTSDYTYRFRWCCYALAWGIRQYDEARAGAQVEA
jgi:hypothetical protein